MEVNIDEMTSTIDAVGTEPAAAGPPPASPDDVQRVHRQLRERLTRDALRTRAENYDD